jgi:rare lipoprotein A
MNIITHLRLRQMPNGPRLLAGLALILSLFLNCVTVATRQDPPRNSPPAARKTDGNAVAKKPPLRDGSTESVAPGLQVEYGKASFIGDKFEGRATASGDIYDRNGLTAAHMNLPFGTICRVTNLSNNQTVKVRINDRFSGTQGRLILISHRAAETLQMVPAGVVEVKLEVLSYPEGEGNRNQRR